MSDTEPQRTLLLTGASRGIGHATVKKFAAEGWRVISCSRQAFSPECPWPGGERNHIQVDLCDPQQTMDAIEVVKNRLDGGRLDALVNNAGTSRKAPMANGSTRWTPTCATGARCFTSISSPPWCSAVA